MRQLSWHSRFGGQRWRVTRQGVEVEGKGHSRTRGLPASVRRVWAKFSRQIREASGLEGVPVELIIATILTESGGRPTATRHEPGYAAHLVAEGATPRSLNQNWELHSMCALKAADDETPHRVSVGLMQTLISTARSALEDQFVDREKLLSPKWSVRAGTAYISQQHRKTGYDPPLVAAAYNAGGIYRQDGARNPWKFRQYPIGTGHHVNRFLAYYNDAVWCASRGELSRSPVSHQSHWFGLGNA